MAENIDFLAHHGVKGMKWGRRKADGSYKNLQKAQKNYDAYVSNVRRRVKALNAVADDVNSGRNPLIRNTNKKISSLLNKMGATKIADLQGEGRVKYDRIINDYFQKSNDLFSVKIVELYGERPS